LAVARLIVEVVPEREIVNTGCVGEAADARVKVIVPSGFNVKYPM